MLKTKLYQSIVLFLFVSITVVFAENSTPNNAEFTAAQKQQIEKITHDYLIANPKILIDVSKALKEAELSDARKYAEKKVPEHSKELFNDSISPIVGNPSGNITLVEFMDYQCPHCKDMDLIVTRLRETNTNLRIIYKELPIMGANSEYAAKAALAAVKQGKYLIFHEALMKADNPLSEESILQIAQKTGLSVEKLKADMQDKDYFFELKNNYALAEAMGIIGTPAFIFASGLSNTSTQSIHSYFIPGPASQGTLQKVIEDIATSGKLP